LAEPLALARDNGTTRLAYRGFSIYGKARTEIHLPESWQLSATFNEGIIANSLIEKHEPHGRIVVISDT
jgi:hypothetical protein